MGARGRPGSVRLAHTRLGTVGYRVVGSGPPLILITGYTATMDDWDPRFVGALAEHYRLVIFDNAGVGRTQALPAPLSIDAMASQASALIDAVGLDRPDVLGWSMAAPSPRPWRSVLAERASRIPPSPGAATVAVGSSLLPPGGAG